MNALILASGEGTRLRPITERIPKPLVARDGVSLLKRQIDALMQIQEIQKIRVSTMYKSAMIEKFLKETYQSSIVSYREAELTGTAKATLEVWEMLGKDKPLMVIYGDVFFANPKKSLSRLLACFQELGDSILGYGPLKEPPTGVMTINTHGLWFMKVTKKFQERPEKIEYPPRPAPIQKSNGCGGSYPMIQEPEIVIKSHAGGLVLSPETYRLLNSRLVETGKPYNLGEGFLPRAIQRFTFCACPIGEHYDVGTIEQYCKLQERIYMNKIKNILFSKFTTLGQPEYEDYPDLSVIFKALYNTKGIIWLVGNGGSLAVAQHAALDLSKAAGRRAICAGNGVCITAYGNDLSFERVYSGYLATTLVDGDILIALSASGESPDILSVVKETNKKGSLTIGLTKRESSLSKVAKLTVEFEEEDPKVLEDMFQITLHKLTRMLEDVRP